MGELSNKTKAMAIALMVGLFLLGGITGAAGMRVYAQRQLRAEIEASPRKARRERRIRAMTRFLDLTPDQVTQIETIMAEAEAKHDEIAKTCGPDLRKLRTETESQIEAVLTDEQRATYDRVRERRRKGRRGRRGRRRGPPPEDDRGPPPGPPPREP